MNEVTLMGLLDSWLRDLRTRNLSPRTIHTVEIEATFADACRPRSPAATSERPAVGVG